MDNETILNKVSSKDFNIDEHVNRVLIDSDYRNVITENMLTHKNIMVYYHCYCIVSKACSFQPDLFYRHWNDFDLLLDHKNSYHRDFGLDLLSKLVEVDHNNLFRETKTRFFRHFTDKKFMTGQHFVKCLENILVNMNDLEDEILDLILNIDTLSQYTVKQNELLKADIINLLDKIYTYSSNKVRIKAFVISQANSLSPKTRKAVKIFLSKHM